MTVSEATCIEDKALPDGTYYLTFTMTDILHHDHTVGAIEVRLDGGRIYYAQP